MSTSHVKPIPDGMHTITPHLVCAGAAAAIEFYKEAFRAVELGRVPGPDGKLLHALIRIGDSPVMLVDEFPDHNTLGPKSISGSPVTIHLYVSDVDAVFAQVIAAGAKSRMPVADMFWGDRFGHLWSVATHVRDVEPKELQAAARQACG